MDSKILVIGIAGGTGSGKTTLMKNLIERFGDVVTVLSHDNYYKRHDEMSYEERCKLNYDEPAAFDTSLMVYHLDQLRHGYEIDCPVYDFTVHNRSEETIRVVPRKVIIVEGILIFENPELRELMDIRIFVDTDADVRLCRRIKRDVNKRGRTLESVLQQYQETVKPMHEKYVEPSKKYASIIVPEGGKNLVALDMIMGRIQRHLAEEEQKMNFESLIFDIDGTLWDSRALVAEGYRLQLVTEGLEHLAPDAETLKGLFGKVLTEIADALFGEIPAPERYALLDRCIERQDRYLEENPCKVGYPGVEETLKVLSEKYRLFIVSNSQQGYPELCMKKLGIEQYFSGHLCFGDTGTEKGLTIRTLMERYHITSAAYIGDTHGDEQAAEAAGIPFIHCKYGFGTADHPMASIDSFPQLTEFL